MSYDELIKTISLMVENTEIKKNGLTMLYELPPDQHKEINETLFKKANPYSTKFEASDEFEVMLGGILVKFKTL
jgi:hypothetical protein